MLDFSSIASALHSLDLCWEQALSAFARNTELGQAVFYTFSDVARLCRTFRGMPCEVSEELRGWSWSSPPLLYPYSFQLSVSDVANSFCESGRFVYLKYVAKERERPSWRLRRGSLVHYVLSEASRTAKSIILSGVSDPQEFKSEFMEKGGGRS